MTVVSKNVYICELDKIVGNTKKTYYGPVKIKTTDVQSSTFFKYGVRIISTMIIQNW